MSLVFTEPRDFTQYAARPS